MTSSTIRKVTRFQYAATLLGALAIFALAPATANATDNDTTGPSAGRKSRDGHGIGWRPVRYPPPRRERQSVPGAPRDGDGGRVSESRRRCRRLSVAEQPGCRC